MPSKIDPNSLDVRANMAAAKAEIEALQAAAMPRGGAMNQVLTKLTSKDYAMGWRFPGTAPPMSSAPPGFVTPETYGLVGDGSTDNSAAFATMCRALSGGGPDGTKGLWLPPGNVYETSGSHGISERADLVIMGNGSGFRRHASLSLAGKTSYHLLMFDRCDWLRVHDLHVDGDRTTVTPVDEFDHLVKIRGPMRDWVFSGCLFEEAQGDCLSINTTLDRDAPANHPTDGVFVGCTFRRAYRNNVSIDHGHRIKFIGCAFIGAEGTLPSAGFDAEPLTATLGTPTLGVSNLAFEGCLFKDNHGTGLMLVASGPTSNWFTTDVTVTGCHFVGNGAGNVGAPTRAAIRLQARRVTIVGNVFRGHTLAPTDDYKPLISVGVGGSENKSSKHVIINNNTFFNNPGCTHIMATNRNIDSFTGDLRKMWVEFSHNFVDVTDGLATGAATGNEDNTPAILSWQYSELRAVGNTFLGDGKIEGVRLVRTGGRSQRPADCTIDDNRFDAFAVGIRNDGAQHSIHNNIFTAVATPLTGGGSSRR